MHSPCDPVGVFDSGVGGISTLACMTGLMPEERFLYYGDTANAPYGTKSQEDILSCVRHVMDALTARHVKAVVIACNTATSAAAAVLRAEMELPIIGMEPALKPASLVRGSGKILVLATPTTLKLPKYHRLEEKYGAGAVPVPCEGLMELVEGMRFDAAEAYLGRLLSAWPLEEIDAVVLGCTHYVFLKPMLRRMLPERIFIEDGNEGTARQLKRILENNGLLCESSAGSVEFLTSGDENKVFPVMKQLYELAKTFSEQAKEEKPL